MSLLNIQAALVLPWQRHSTTQLTRPGPQGMEYLLQHKLGFPRASCDHRAQRSFSEAMWLGGKGQDHESQEEITTAWVGVQA